VNTRSNQTRHWQALDAAHHVHPFSDTAALNKEGVRVVTRGEGVYLWDSEGHKIIDGMSGLWCVQVGYGNEELAEAGYEALKRLPYYNHFFKTSNPWTIELAASDKRALITRLAGEFTVLSEVGSKDIDMIMAPYRWVEEIEAELAAGAWKVIAEAREAVGEQHRRQMPPILRVGGLLQGRQVHAQRSRHLRRPHAHAHLLNVRERAPVEILAAEKRLLPIHDEILRVQDAAGSRAV